MKRVESFQAPVIVEKNGSRPTLDDITIIIPTLGRPILKQCLQAIAGGTVLPARVILIDQSDNIQTSNWLKDLDGLGLKILHLRSGEKGPASARNEGIRQVQTAFIGAVDDDCIPNRDWLENLELQLRQTPEFIVTGRVDPAGDGNAPTIVSSSVSFIYRHPSIRFPSPLTTGNMGVALRIAQRIGPFDPILLTAEDNDWAYRALRDGISILYAPEVIVRHFHWRDKSQLAAAYHAYALGQGMFYGKHLRRGDWSMIARTAISLFRGARDFLQGSMAGDETNRVNGLARMSWLIPGLIAGLRGSNWS